MKHSYKKTGSWILVAAIILVFLAGSTAFAQDAGTQLCAAHPTHDESCGYAKAVAEAPCGHIHTGECGFTEETGAESCEHVHDEICGYAAAADARQCTHTHDTACETIGETGISSAGKEGALPGVEETQATVKPMLFENDPPRIDAGTISLASTSVSAPGELTLHLDVLGSEIYGVNYVGMIFMGSDGREIELKTHLDAPLQKGSHQVALRLENYMVADTYEFLYMELGNITQDATQFTQYRKSRSPSAGTMSLDEQCASIPYSEWQSAPYTGQLDFTITSATQEDTISPVIDLATASITTKTITAPGKVALYLDLKEDGAGLSSISFVMTGPSGDTVNPSVAFATPLKTGSHTIQIDIPREYSLPGQWTFSQAALVDAAGNMTGIQADPAAQLIYQMDNAGVITQHAYDGGWDFTVAGEAPSSTVELALDSIKLVNNTVTAPGMLELALTVTKPGAGVFSGYIAAKYEDGQDVYFEWMAVPGQELGAGAHTIRIMVDPYWFEAGNYDFTELMFMDRYGQTYEAEKNGGNIISGAASIPNNGQLDITVINSLEMDVSTRLNDPGLAERIKNMPEGGIAYVDCCEDTGLIAYAELFHAIAGRDKTLIFACMENSGWRMHWVFRGMDIIESQIKDVDLATTVGAVEEADGEKEAPVTFAPNGTLPGKASIEVYAGWVSALYEENGNSLFLWYKNTDGSRTYMGDDVRLRPDSAVIFDITHTSGYVLSTRKDTSPPVPEDAAITRVESVSPKTGDDSGIALWMTLAIAAGGALAFALYRRRAHNTENQ